MAFTIEFNFTEKWERLIPIAESALACKSGNYCWIDLDGEEIARTHEILNNLGIDPVVIETIENCHAIQGFELFPKCLHFIVEEMNLVNGNFSTNQVQVVLGERFMLTIHKRPIEFLRQVYDTYRDDFYTISRSPGFLLFELVDHLTQVYHNTLTIIINDITEIQKQLFGDTTDIIFSQVAEKMRCLRDYRKVVISARDIFDKLATRKSPFINESTQPFLEKKAALLDRLGNDVATEREVLSESLNLYMGIVTHKTNRFLNRLTLISTVFLPLSFIAGVYGMNFDYFPELHWRYGYPMFWVVALIIVYGLLQLIKKVK